MALAPSRIDRRRFETGDTVEVRSLTEILATLDADGKLDGMPFMPEMADYCGQRLTVRRRAEKTCVEGHPMRRLDDCVLLEGIRCNGSRHDGCQRACMIFWKTAWLTHVDDAEEPTRACLGADTTSLRTRVGDRYFCQSTELYSATRPLSKLDPWPYLGDLFTGQQTLGQFLFMIGRMASVQMRRLFRRMPGGELSQTPRGAHGFEPGDLVTIKPAEVIEATLDVQGKNRGLSFEVEMLDHCGQQCRVAFPVKRIILEQTGEMLELGGTVALEGVICRGTCAKNCPRANYFFWREIWLEPASNGAAGSAEQPSP